VESNLKDYFELFLTNSSVIYLIESVYHV